MNNSRIISIINKNIYYLIPSSLKNNEDKFDENNIFKHCFNIIVKYDEKFNYWNCISENNSRNLILNQKITTIKIKGKNTFNKNFLNNFANCEEFLFQENLQKFDCYISSLNIKNSNWTMELIVNEKNN